MPADPSPRPHRPLQPLPSHAPHFILPCAGPSSLSLFAGLSPLPVHGSSLVTPRRCASPSPRARARLSLLSVSMLRATQESKASLPALLPSEQGRPCSSRILSRGCESLGRTSAHAQGAAQAQAQGRGRRGRGKRAAGGAGVGEARTRAHLHVVLEGQAHAAGQPLLRRVLPAHHAFTARPARHSPPGRHGPPCVAAAPKNRLRAGLAAAGDGGKASSGSRVKHAAGHPCAAASVSSRAAARPVSVRRSHVRHNRRRRTRILRRRRSAHTACFCSPPPPPPASPQRTHLPRLVKPEMRGPPPAGLAARRRPGH
jgi:hypothetical protein